MRQCEAGDDEEQTLERASQEKQADEEEQMVGTDEDVVGAHQHELLDDRKPSLSRAGEVLVLGLGVVEDSLRGERLALVDVQKRLVVLVVRKQGGRKRHHARPSDEVSVGGQPQRLPLGQTLGG